MRNRFGVILGIFFVGGFFLLWLTVEVSNWFLAPLLLLFGVCALLLEIKFRCPQCRKSVFINPVRILGTDVWLAMPLIPAKCSRCGAELE
jgi:hypothetical protein